MPPRTASTAGVLRPDELARHLDLRRDPAGAGVARWVENHWSLAWELPDGRWYDSEVVPHPTCSLTHETGSHPRAGMPAGRPLVLTGVATRRFDVEIRGHGRVRGIRFRPGGLAALTGRGVADLADRTVDAREVLPPEVCEALTAVGATADDAAWRAHLEAAVADVAALGPDAEGGDTRYDTLLTVVADMLEDHSLLTVAAVAERHGTTVRTLQRLFGHYVGVSPKWVLARYRMHDALAELDAGYDGPVADLAVRWGWYDQAHFTRDFTALVGVPPGRYRDRTRAAT